MNNRLLRPLRIEEAVPDFGILGRKQSVLAEAFEDRFDSQDSHIAEFFLYVALQQT